MSSAEPDRESLVARLAIGLVAVTLAVLVAGFAVLLVIIRIELTRQVDGDLELRLEAIGRTATDRTGAIQEHAVAPRFQQGSHEDYFEVWNAAGQVLARSDSSHGRDLARPAVVPDRPAYYDTALPDGHRGRAIAAGFTTSTRGASGRLEIVVAEETENLTALYRRIALTLVATAVVALLVVIASSTRLVNRGLRPLNDLAHAFQSEDHDRLKARLDSHRFPIELEPFATSFSSLLGKLFGALERERRYARNVAHELRNPLAELRLLSDVALDHGDPGDMRRAMREIGATTIELERIVESLLALSRYQAGLETPQPEPFELGAEVRRQIGAMQGVADKKRLTIDVDVPRDLWVHTDSALARRVLANLVGNAIAHAPDGATVSVRLHADGELTFTNPAPHLTAADIPKLGEQFLSIGTSSGAAHAGLGLSLAYAIARILEIRLALAMQDDGCLVVSLSGWRTLDELASSQATPTDG